jgi:hypothetical protein
MNFFKDDRHKTMHTDMQCLAKRIAYIEGVGFDAGMRRVWC